MRTDGQGRNTTARALTASAMLFAAFSAAACRGGDGREAMTADLERDLQMAIDARPAPSMVVSAIEGGPVNAPSGTERGRRDAVPTPRRMPRPTPRAEVVQEAAVTPQLEEAAAPAVVVSERVEPTPAPVPEPAAVEPAPEPVLGPAAGRGPSAGAGEGDGHGDMGTGRGRRGGGWGTVIGVIIRGGTAGVDNCEEHDRRRTRRGGGYGGGVITAGGVLGGVIGGVIANNGGTIRPTFPR